MDLRSYRYDLRGMQYSGEDRENIGRGKADLHESFSLGSVRLRLIADGFGAYCRDPAQRLLV
jgi:hypothetical protein